jgi:hypothetical protein
MDRFKKLRAHSHQIPRPSIASFLPRSSSENNAYSTKISAVSLSAYDSASGLTTIKILVVALA